MKKSVLIILIAAFIIGLIALGVHYLVLQTKSDDLLIGEEKAIEIALKDASLSQDRVEGLEAKLKHHGSKWYYTVEFETIALEYEYEIEAYTGGILEKDIDNK